jgi:tetratricopeptide (TPR) repeat protein
VLRKIALPAVALTCFAALASLSIVRVGEGERAFRRAAGGNAATRLPPGWHLVVPFLHHVERVPTGTLRASSSAQVRSREGVDLRVTFDVGAEIEDATLANLLGAEAGADPRESMRAAAEAAIAAWGARSSGESLVLLEGVTDVEAGVRKQLEERGFDAVTVRLGRVTGPAEAIASIEARALRERLADTKTKIAIIGLDGADWEIIDPLIATGQLPNLARLKARGAWGNMKTMSPALSPLLWTTVATGKPPEEHGIIDFLVKDPETGKPAPVTGRSRRVKALWNIFTDVGRTSAFVAWWATWPAETVQGLIVSDRVAYSLFVVEGGEGALEGLTYPAAYYQEIRPKLVRASDISVEELGQFVEVGPEALRAAREVVKHPVGDGGDPVQLFARFLSSARTYQAIALDLLGRGQPDLFAVYYQGIDEVCHRFAHYMPPKMKMVTEEEYRRYRDTVFAYYRYQDRLLGQVLERLSRDTTILVLSDHGFMSGGGRPQNDPPYVEGKPGLWHRRYGILILAGPAIRPGRLDTSGLLDIAPTVLYLAGLPIPEDMKGRVITEAIDDRFRERFPVRTIPSYEGIGKPLEGSRAAVVQTDGEMDAEMVERLRKLGYVGGKDDQALVTAHLNEAGLHLKNKDYGKAEAAVARALKIGPNLVPALMMAGKIEAEQKRYGPAIDLARKVIEMDPLGERGLYLEIGRLYSESGRAGEGLEYLGRARRLHPDVPEIHAALGSILLGQGRTEEAEKELLEALRLDPAQGDPLTELHKIYRGTEKILTLEPIVRKGLAINDKSVVHHNWMGLVHEWKRELPQAEKEFKRAMELDPDYAATMANLGALYGRNGRLREAVEVLTRAVRKDPENVESWVNLGAAQGRLGRSREAIEALETARRKGVRTTTLFNALGLAYLQDRRRDKAIEYFRESLAIDPTQSDVTELLNSVRRPS